MPHHAMQVEGPMESADQAGEAVGGVLADFSECEGTPNR